MAFQTDFVPEKIKMCRTMEFIVVILPLVLALACILHYASAAKFNLLMEVGSGRDE